MSTIIGSVSVLSFVGFSAVLAFGKGIGRADYNAMQIVAALFLFLFLIAAAICFK